MQPTNIKSARPYQAGAKTALERVLATLSRSLPEGMAFDFQMPGGSPVRVGHGNPAFLIAARNQTAVNAIRSFDEVRIGEAYLNGDLDIEGDLVAALDLRNSLSDRHLLAYLWSTFGQKLFYGQANRDEKWISEHYDASPEFYLAFLDPKYRCYSHGYYANDDEPLESAIERKLETAMANCGIGPGSRVLDIGAGWGAFTQFAGERGAQVTSLTISAESEAYVKELITRRSLNCQVVRQHFLEYKSEEPYDAIVNLGVTEHLPDYRASLVQYDRLLKPGGRVYLDACASRTKYPFSTFVLKYVWPGNATPMHLPGYMEAVAETAFETVMIQNDRRSYLLTTKAWAENLDRNRDVLVALFGESLYRRFRIYLWGCVHCFSSDVVTAYRWMLEKPRGSGRTGLTRSTPAKMFRSMRRAFGSGK